MEMHNEVCVTSSLIPLALLRTGAHVIATALGAAGAVGAVEALGAMGAPGAAGAVGTAGAVGAPGAVLIFRELPFASAGRSRSAPCNHSIRAGLIDGPVTLPQVPLGPWDDEMGL